MIFCGVDCGKTGAISLIDRETNLLVGEVFETPKKIFHPLFLKEQLENILSPYQDEVIIGYIEKPIFRGKIGNKNSVTPSKSVATMARNYSILHNTLLELEVKLFEIVPVKWTSELYKGMSFIDVNNEKVKEKSIIRAKELFPTANFFKSEQSKNIHTGLTDSALIAFYAWLNFGSIYKLINNYQKKIIEIGA